MNDLARELRTHLKELMLMQGDVLELHQLPVSEIVRKYYDGVVDKQVHFALRLKTKKPLDHIEKALTCEQIIVSATDCYDLGNIAFTNEPDFIKEDEEGFKHYQLTIQALLTIYN